MRLVIKTWQAALAATVLGCAARSACAQVEKPSIKFSQGWLFHATQAQFPLAADTSTTASGHACRWVPITSTKT